MWCNLVSLTLTALTIVLIAYVVFAWIPRPPDPIRPLVRATQRLVDPLLRPIRRVMPGLQVGGVGLDLSILVLFFAVYLVRVSLPC